MVLVGRVRLLFQGILFGFGLFKFVRVVFLAQLLGFFGQFFLQSLFVGIRPFGQFLLVLRQSFQGLNGEQLLLIFKQLLQQSFQTLQGRRRLLGGCVLLWALHLLQQFLNLLAFVLPLLFLSHAVCVRNLKGLNGLFQRLHLLQGTFLEFGFCLLLH